MSWLADHQTTTKARNNVGWSIGVINPLDVCELLAKADYISIKTRRSQNENFSQFFCRLAENQTVAVKVIPLNDEPFCENFPQNFLVISKSDFLATPNWTSSHSMVTVRTGNPILSSCGSHMHSSFIVMFWERSWVNLAVLTGLE